MKNFVVLFKVLCLPLIINGCASSSNTTLDDVRTSNRENLPKLTVGMKKNQVLGMMGTKTIVTKDGSKINNPYTSETVMDSDGQVYEILFYYTNLNSIDDVISQDELTPVILTNDTLAGWGWNLLKEKIENYTEQTSKKASW
ncbi:MAG: DUF3192 domain-containing protein [Planctomycetes bacterium]|nr:DUF3192 domain-containing protein [Planctomycetota bacterium]